MKLTLTLAAALFAGSASLAAVQALPIPSDMPSGGVVEIAAKVAKPAKTAKVHKTAKTARVHKAAKTAKAGSCKGVHMYWSAKDKKCMDARNKKTT
jgi:hypothetical protein